MDVDRQLLEKLEANLTTRKRKLVKLFGTADVVVTNFGLPSASCRFVIDPDRTSVKLWRSVVFFIMVYNFYQTPFRITFLPDPAQSIADWITLVDIAYKDNASGKVTDRASIRKHYVRTRFKIDLLSVLPIYFGEGHFFAQSLSRLPRFLKNPQLLEELEEIEEEIQERFLSGSTALLSIFDMAKYFAFFLSATHQTGSIYYLLGRLQIKHGVAPASWITADVVLSAKPNDASASYVRSVYWCLETDAHEHEDRVQNFEEYAKRRNLPAFFRERAKESLEFKSKSLLHLNASKVFADIPRFLHVMLFDELYGGFLRRIPEFKSCFSLANF